MNEPIEILEGVFYDPKKQWFEQPQELIYLALEIEQTTPIDYDMEVSGKHERIKCATWRHTTEKGTFEMRVELIWLADIDARNFLSKAKHNQVTITKI